MTVASVDPSVDESELDEPSEEDAALEAQIGQQLGPYRIVRKIGEGGMGVVFEAVHTQIEQRVAIKVLRGRIAKDKKTFQRFENEARAIGKMAHPGLVNIHGYEQQPNGVAYLVMEFLAGEPLVDRLERLNAAKQRLPLPHALYLIRQVASVLAVAHAHGIVHCDLKPDNVFLVSDPLLEFGERVKVLDFGIAKFVAGGGTRKTTVGLVLGTPLYMSPEQCEGREGISDKTDVYSLGVMLYELLCGEPPFQADSSAALLRQHMIKPPPPIKDRAPGLPPQVIELVEQMLAKEPAERPTVADVCARLERLNGASLLPAKSGPTSRQKLMVAGACIALLMAGSGLFAMQSRRSSAATKGGTRQPVQQAPLVPTDTHSKAAPDRVVEPSKVAEAEPAPHTTKKEGTSRSSSRRKKAESARSSAGAVGADAPKAAVAPADPPPPSPPPKEPATAPPAEVKSAKPFVPLR